MTIRSNLANDLHLQLTSYRTLIFAVAGLAASEFAPPGDIAQFLGHLSRDLGIALLVGLYITWTLERLNSARRDKELGDYVRTVGENLVKAVYGKDLPADLFQVVRRSIFSERFLRTYYVSDWTLHNLTRPYIDSAPRDVRALLQRFADTLGDEKLAEDHLLVIRFSVSYEILNVDSVEREYPIRWVVPLPFGGNYPGLCGITSVLIDRVQQLTEVYSMTADQQQFPDATRLNYVKVVSIPAGKTVRLELEAYSVRTSDDKEQWQTLIPSKGMSIRVTDADGDKDVFLSLDAPLLEGSEAFARKEPRTNKASLDITQYLLPYQGVTVTWTPARSAEGATSVTCLASVKD